jgi:Na+-translocating ferredoxin:NAD+ oxidoreductase RnfD subunit
MRSIFTHMIAVYIGAGLFGALLMKAAIPAMNPLGMVYFTVSWPQQIICARADSRCDPMPAEWLARHMFSFGATHD